MGGKKKEPVPQKIVQSASETAAKAQEKYFCLECFEVCLKGRRKEYFATVCRIDTSSINRHKQRWHNHRNIRTRMLIGSRDIVEPWASKMEAT